MPASVITDLSYRSDTIFLATENGIAFVPEKLESDNNAINTYLISAEKMGIGFSTVNTYTKCIYEKFYTWHIWAGPSLITIKT